MLMYGLKAGTRLHEVGIPSNRESPCRGENQSLECTNCSSRAEILVVTKVEKTS